MAPNRFSNNKGNIQGTLLNGVAPQKNHIHNPKADKKKNRDNENGSKIEKVQC